MLLPGPRQGPNTATHCAAARQARGFRGGPASVLTCVGAAADHCIAIRHWVKRRTTATAEDLKRYFTVARRTLGEDDPSLDLPEEDRWLANLRGKTREFSSGLRRGISETLVLLATQGPHLFKTRLGLDIEGQVNSIVSDLLGEAPTTRTFQSHDRDLSTYAEAAPETFLTILERDLRTEAPATLGLLKPVDSSNMFGSPSRTGLLWVLEGLAWNPVTLPRVASILAKLATVEIKDNWGNKPINSLLSIFRSWMPQTAAPLDERVAILKSMARKFPEVAWKICVTQFASFNDVGDYTHKPRWRPDGFGFGEPHPTRGPTYDFVREMVEMALTWQGYSQPMLCDLVERIHNLAPEHQKAVWKLIQAWSTTATDNEKAVVREKIRVSSLSQRAARRAKRAEHQTNLVPNAKAAYDALEPADVINRNAWLFTSAWVDETAEELENIEDMDYHLREERVARLRASAMHEVHAQLGLKGLLDLATAGGASGAVGWISASEILQPAELIELVQMAYEAARRSASDAPQLRSLISSALWAMANEAERESVLLKASHGWTVEDTVGLLIMAPFSRSTWSLLEALDKAATKACEVVRDVLEELHSENMVHGVSIGAYNARGVHWRGEGGDQERELAKKYRSWENSLRITHPFVASPPSNGSSGLFRMIGVKLMPPDGRWLGSSPSTL